ncbi:YlmG-like protein 2 [Nymphaea thermarum]|nr:YlmG-like protein 2 [Nymphaea thermarum]
MALPSSSTGDDHPNRLLASAVRLLPFSPPPPLPLKPAFEKPVHDLHRLNSSIVAAANQFIRTVMTEIVSKNPLVQGAVALSADLRNFCNQVHRARSLTLNSFSAHNFAAIIPGDSVAGLVVANGISNFLSIYNTLLVIRLVLTWFPNSPPAIVSPLSTLCDPYLNIFRGLIPPLGGTLDLSPILAFLVLNAFTSTAAALPAELPVDASSREATSFSHGSPLNSTVNQRMWYKRLSSRGSRKSDAV